MTEIEVSFRPKGGFPLFLEDLERDTVGWSLADRYHYIRLLDHMYRMGGFIPNDDNHICEVVGLHKGRGYKKVVAKLRGKLATKDAAIAFANAIANGNANGIAKAFAKRLVSETNGDWLTQKRVLKEVAKSFQNHKIASAGGQAKAEKDRAASTGEEVLEALPPTLPYKNVSKDTPADAAPVSPSGDDPPPLAKVLFDHGVALLTGNGVAEKSARSIIGRLQKAVGDGEALKIIDEARAKTDPKGWIMGVINRRKREQEAAAKEKPKRQAPMEGSEEARRRREFWMGAGTS